MAAASSPCFLPLSKPSNGSSHRFQRTRFPFPCRPRRCAARAVSTADDGADAIQVRRAETVDKKDGLVSRAVTDMEGANGSGSAISGVGGFAFEGGAGAAGGMGGASGDGSFSSVEVRTAADMAINAAIVLTAGAFAITNFLTIDQDYWHGWTIYEILRYAPQHNWTAYEEALKTNPVLAKMMISGIVYSLGDWIAQCYEGKPLFEFDRARMFRSGLVGFALHGSLSHYYYHFCEALFPFHDWWVVPAKVAFDQTLWSAFWNSIYFLVVGFLRMESPANMYTELRATFWPMLTAGWKLWPFAHLITYGLIPVEQRLLWVDCVELVWVTILSTYSNENSETRSSEVVTALPSTSSRDAQSDGKC